MNKFIIVLLVFIFLLEISFSQNFICNIRSGNCLSGETCLFKIYSPSNSHVASCDYSYSYSVCCNLLTASIKSSCSPDEGGIISLFQLNNSHVEKFNYSNYPYHVCAKFDVGSPVAAYYRENTNCYSNETALVSLYNITNSHVAEPNYYSNKICLSKYSDLIINSSSVILNNSNPVVGDIINITIKVFNDGEVSANNVNVTCYDNSTYFDSYIIPSIPAKGFSYAYCIWRSTCNINHNLTFIADPNNQIFEYNESNNNFNQSITLMERLFIRIDNPSNNMQFYRNETVNLQSTVWASCNPVINYNVYWYNESTLIGTGEDITWRIPLDDSLLGRKTIKAYVNKSGYADNFDQVNITILNNLPKINITLDKYEVEVGDSLTVFCEVSDVEDSASLLNVNASIKDSLGNWNNATADLITGNLFSRNLNIAFNAPLGIYTATCSAIDTDNGYNESSTTFIVYQNVTIVIRLNKTNYLWNESVGSSILVYRRDGSLVKNGTVTVYLENEKKCEGKTNDNGRFNCNFLAPLRIGRYNYIVIVQDPISTKYFSNSTLLSVEVFVGEDIEKIKARIISCHEEPRAIRNPDGSLSIVKVKVCIVRE